MFADQATILIRSGKGGDGHVSFRRELYVPSGGPDGGNGGRGGDLIFEVDTGLNTLNDFRHARKFCAGDGEPGRKRRCHGADGEDLVVKVPEGTIVREASSGKVIVDMSRENRRVVVLKGGRGGKGNMNYATATMQAPQYAQPGQPGKELKVTLELKVIADVGLVGFPNAGKSTLLTAASNARPKIADYPFTTLNPILGVVDLDGDGYVIADIPGLIEGAAQGIGLGHDFLRHIQRTRVMIHVVDAASLEGRDPVEDIRVIQNELRAYDPELCERPFVIAANKMDLLYGEEREKALSSLRNAFGDIPIYPISAATGEGVKALLYGVKAMLDQIAKKPVFYESEYDPEEGMTAFEEPFTVQKEEDGAFRVEGPRVERMLGYTNLESEKGFRFFQQFLKKNGILDELEALGIQDGDTVRIYGLEFDYYKE